MVKIEMTRTVIYGLFMRTDNERKLFKKGNYEIIGTFDTKALAETFKETLEERNGKIELEIREIDFYGLKGGITHEL